MTVNKPRIQLWVDALRSGDHVQTTGRLARMNGGVEERCCLGVACVVAGAEREESAAWDDTIKVSYDGEHDVIPTSVQAWFGLPDENPYLDVSGDPSIVGDEQTAAELNDSYHYTFNDLADAIERTYLS